MIRRHTASCIAMHWLNAACWLTLLGSGFALMSNPVVQPVGLWWPHLWEAAIGAGGTLTMHVITGLLWVTAFVLYLLVYRSAATSFMREILDISLVQDISWCMGKGPAAYARQGEIAQSWTEIWHRCRTPSPEVSTTPAKN